MQFDTAVKRMLAHAPVSYLDAANDAVRAFRKTGLNSFDAMTSALPTMDEDMLIIAARLLPYLNHRKAPRILLQVLRSTKSPLVMLEVSKVLGSLTSAHAGQAVNAALARETAEETRYWLVYILGCMAEPKAGQQLLAILQDSGNGVAVRSQAAEGLAYILPRVGRKRALYQKCVDALLDELHSPNPELRFWATFALGSLRVRRALPELRRLARSDHAQCPGWWSVACEARDAIHVIGGAAWPPRTPQRECEAERDSRLCRAAVDYRPDGVLANGQLTT